MKLTYGSAEQQYQTAVRHERLRFRWLDLLTVLLIISIGVAFIVYLLTSQNVSPSPSRDLVERFNDRITRALNAQPLSPLTVTLYERLADNSNNNLATTDVLQLPENGETLDALYNERLIVVRPHNWIVYTNNGLNFYLLTNNVSNRTAKCDLDTQMVAIDFRLKTITESDESTDDSGRLKVACLNYTMDTLVRLFGNEYTRRSYFDMSKYFDKRYNPSAPKIVVDEVIDYLLAHDYL